MLYNCFLFLINNFKTVFSAVDKDKKWKGLRKKLNGAIPNDYKEKKEKNSVLGSIAGGAVGITSSNFLKRTGAGAFTKKFIKETELTEESAKLVQKGVQDAFEKSGIKEKGFQIKLANKENADDIARELADETLDYLKKFIKPKNIENSKFSAELMLSSMVDMVADGKNAFCMSKFKKIILPDGKLTTAGFHEIGHAMNSMSKLGKLAQGPLRLIGMIAPIGITLFGAFTKNKKAEESDDYWLDE